MIRGLLFDLDGTLVSTKAANFGAYRDAFKEFGYSLDSQEFDRIWGQDSRDFIPELVEGVSPSTVAAIRVRKSVLYESYVDQTIPNEPLINFLRLVRPRHKTALVTTAQSVNGLRILAAHGLKSLFDVLVFGDTVSRSKPDPEGYATALRRMGVGPHEAIAFEDSGPGREAAMAAGLRVITVPQFL